MAKAKIQAEEPFRFSKERLVRSKRFEKYKDYLMGNLEDGQDYSIEEVEKMLSKVFER